MPRGPTAPVSETRWDFHQKGKEVRSILCFFVLFLSTAAPADDVRRVAFAVQPEVAFQELSPDHCWFHARAAAIPGMGKDGMPRVVMTLQKHLRVSDYYSGEWGDANG